MTPRVVVVGAGISGLSAAFTLLDAARASGHPVELTVLDAGKTPGGHAQTRRMDGFLVEGGPNGFLDKSPEARALVDALGLGTRVVEASREAKRRFVLRRGRLCRVPDSPAGLLTSPVLSIPGRLRVLCEPFVGSASEGDETVFEFARRRIGAEAADALVDTAVAGISAGDSRRLSVAAQFPLMRAMERDHGSLVRAMFARRRSSIGPPRLVAFDAGMRTLVGELAVRLGASLRLGARVDAIWRVGGEWRVSLEGGEAMAADHVLVAAPARTAAPMLRDLDPSLAAALGAIPYAGLAVVSLGYRATDVPRPLDGYGYLVARSEGLATLGVLWESSIFPGRAPEEAVLLRVMLGGSRRPDVVEWTDEARARVARSELAEVMGIRADPVHQSVTTWPRAIAQYTVGHLERRAAIEQHVARHPGLAVCGTSYDGVSFTDAIASGVRAAERLTALCSYGLRVTNDEYGTNVPNPAVLVTRNS
jgi:oxygen-dependent protoporphyrinogen oxidase